MIGKHRTDIIEPTLMERLEFLIQTWEADIEQLLNNLRENKYPENYSVDRAWTRSKIVALRDIKRVLNEGDG